jgi:hypothetical protein
LPLPLFGRLLLELDELKRAVYCCPLGGGRAKISERGERASGMAKIGKEKKCACPLHFLLVIRQCSALNWLTLRHQCDLVEREITVSRYLPLQFMLLIVFLIILLENWA